MEMRCQPQLRKTRYRRCDFMAAASDEAIDGGGDITLGAHANELVGQRGNTRRVRLGLVHGIRHDASEVIDVKHVSQELFALVSSRGEHEPLPSRPIVLNARAAFVPRASRATAATG